MIKQTSRVIYKLSTHHRNILIFGAPGSGKGTYSKLLNNQFGFKHVSIGDEFRKLSDKIKNNQSTHIQVDQSLFDQIQKGELVDDQKVVDLLVHLISKQNHKYLIDGFPRTIQQFDLLQKSAIKVDLVINVKLRTDILIKKLDGRRVCKQCGTSYNLCKIDEDGYDMPPLLPQKRSEYCDNCDSLLYRRQDDSKKVIAKRLQTYYEVTHTLLDQFVKHEIPIIEFEPKKGIADFPTLADMVRKTL